MPLLGKSSIVNSVKYGMDIRGQTIVGSANVKARCRYQSCNNPNKSKARTSIQACHLQNWLSPCNVSSNSSTPLLAKIRHIPARMPENEEKERARRRRVRVMNEYSLAESETREECTLGALGFRRGVCSVRFSSLTKDVRLRGGDCDLGVLSA